MSFTYLTTIIPGLQCDGYHSTEKESKEDLRRHGTKYSRKIYDTSMSNRMKQRPLKLINDSGEHLSPNVPSCTQGSKKTKKIPS
jgi:hypothetical protein